MLESGRVGYVEVGQMYLKEPGRYANCAAFIAEGSDQESEHLLDVDIERMGKDRFTLEGSSRKGAYQTEPEALHRNGWLCAYRPQEDRTDRI